MAIELLAKPVVDALLKTFDRAKVKPDAARTAGMFALECAIPSFPGQRQPDQEFP